MNADEGWTRRLRRIYGTHPLSAGAIAGRALARRRPPDLSELDLAWDEDRGPTDQNHVGGAGAVIELAEIAGVSPASRVLDIGSGLGGPARLLASRYGASVRGIDLSPRRHEEARLLSRLVGLDDRVRFSCGDFTRSAPGPPGGTFDLVWGQGSWAHVPDREALFDRAAAHLRAGGRIAFEEACLRRPPASRAERGALERLSRLWVARVPTLPDWLRACEQRGFAVRHCEALDDRLHEHLESRLERSPSGRDEDREWRTARLAKRLAEDGLLSYLRVVAAP